VEGSGLGLIYDTSPEYALVNRNHKTRNLGYLHYISIVIPDYKKEALNNSQRFGHIGTGFWYTWQRPFGIRSNRCKDNVKIKPI
jgi:hypothetical protein